MPSPGAVGFAAAGMVSDIGWRTVHAGGFKERQEWTLRGDR